ncbi:hypothetical protein CRD60_05215 [Bifidobacterium aemilianum]|uniref:Uncharacterized protein n=1 Tax=Bifidobacterium aemilianum TaxID=2493120 RepID=A0A366K938_9BIFI|nr:hypothetical protein CRD60_05215 [Bifidobacterium aemilianum]
MYAPSQRVTDFTGMELLVNLNFLMLDNDGFTAVPDSPPLPRLTRRRLDCNRIAQLPPASWWAATVPNLIEFGLGGSFTNISQLSGLTKLLSLYLEGANGIKADDLSRDLPLISSIYLIKCEKIA